MKTTREVTTIPAEEPAVSTGPADRVASPQGATLVARVGALLDQRSGLPPGQLKVSEAEGAIVLEGEVTRFYDRRVALACAKHVHGVRRIVDQIAVRDPERRAMDATS